jgi:hypothetical protein
MVHFKIMIYAAIAMAFYSCTSKPFKPHVMDESDHNLKVEKTIKQESVLAKDSPSFPSLEGLYEQKSDDENSESCNLAVKIEKLKDGFYYTLSLQDSVIKGRVTVLKSEEGSDFKYMVTLEGIKWASYEGDVSDEDKPHPQLKIPVGIEAGFSDNELVFQNYGNSMNSYTVLEECGQKYIRFVKQ